MRERPSSLCARDIANEMHPNVDLRRFEAQGARIMDSGKGVWVTDIAGNRFIDGMAGLWCVGLGYGEPRLVEAARRQMEKLSYFQTSAYKSNEPAILLAEKLIQMAPVPMSKVHFTNSGSEANDLVAKMLWYRSNAMGLPQKKKIISRIKGYHGATIAAGSITGIAINHKAFDLPLERMKHTSCPSYVHFAKEGESEEAFTARMLSELEELIQAEGPETVAAFWGEPMMAAGGVLTPPVGYWSGVQKILDEHDILLVMDEIVTGFGRTGKMFGSQTYDIKPDVMVLSKQLTSSYLPLSAVVMNDRFYQPLADQSQRIGNFAHSYTTTGHPVATALGLENIRIIEERNLVERVQELSPLFFRRLEELSRHGLAKSFRGVGLIGAVETKSFKNLEPGEAAKLIATAAEEEGVISRAIGDGLCFCPPMIISEAETNEMFDRVLKAMDKVAAKIG